MFFSINHEKFGDVYPYLRKFVHQKEKKYLPENIKIYCYYNVEGSNRYIGQTILGDFPTGRTIALSEITFAPMGFVMTIDSPAPDARLTDISFFSEFEYNQWIDHHQKFATLPTYLPFYPGDYRTKYELKQLISAAGRH